MTAELYKNQKYPFYIFQPQGKPVFKLSRSQVGGTEILYRYNAYYTCIVRWEINKMKETNLCMYEES